MNQPPFPTRLLEEFSNRFNDLMANSPAKDLERNARALFVSMAGRLDLVTREEFDVQREVLARAVERIERLEARLAELEAARQKP